MKDNFVPLIYDPSDSKVYEASSKLYPRPYIDQPLLDGKIVHDNMLENYEMKPSSLSIYDKVFFRCPNCPKVYRGKYTLSRHLRLECGKTPTNRCFLCGQLFTHKHRLISHLKSIHSDYLKNTNQMLLEHY